jgi:hypothetical protein
MSAYFLLLSPLNLCIQGHKIDLQLMVHESKVVKTSSGIHRNYFEIEKQILTQFSDYTEKEIQ